MAGLHAFLPPSGAGEWVACAMWPTMNRLYPKDDTESAMEGTAAHWVFERFLAGHEVLEGEQAPNGVLVTEEMLDGAELFVMGIDSVLMAAGCGREALHIEERVSCAVIHEQNWGTPDAWFYDIRTGTLWVFDYKFGFLQVEARENWQCVDYIAGIIETHKLDDLAVDAKITIVQPRNYHGGGQVSTWSARASDLRAMWNRLRSAALEACMPQPKATPGEQCVYCPGRHACATLQRQAYKAAHVARISAPLDLTPVALGTELAMLEETKRLLDARVSGLQEEVFARIKRGQRVQGFAIEQSLGRENWKIPAAQVLAIGQMYGKNLSKDATVTPKQAIKLGLPAALVSAYAGAENKGLKLVVDDGKKATKVFDGIVKAE